MNLTN